MPEVVAIGETMVLFVAEQVGPLREATTFRRHVAGAESTVAIGLCRLGRSAGWISRLGDDEFGRTVLFRLQGEGVDTSRVVIDARRPTGVFFRERREHGPIEVVYYRRGSAASALSPDDLDPGFIAAARYLYLTGITPALSESCRQTMFAAAEVARGANVPVVFDPNYRSKLWRVDEARKVLLELVRQSDIVLAGLPEAELLTRESDPKAGAQCLVDLGVRLVVLKLGPEGALALGDRLVRCPADRVHRVVDPVGAGDAFAAGFLAGLLMERSLEGCLQLGNLCGAWAVAGPGDVEGLLRLEELAGPQASSDIRR